MSENSIKLTGLSKITEEEYNAKSVKRISNRPSAQSRYGNSGMTAEEFKEALDAPSSFLKEKINALVDALCDLDALGTVLTVGSTDYTISDLILGIRDGRLADLILFADGKTTLGDFFEKKGEDWAQSVVENGTVPPTGGAVYVAITSMIAAITDWADSVVENGKNPPTGAAVYAAILDAMNRMTEEINTAINTRSPTGHTHTGTDVLMSDGETTAQDLMERLQNVEGDVMNGIEKSTGVAKSHTVTDALNVLQAIGIRILGKTTVSGSSVTNLVNPVILFGSTPADASERAYSVTLRSASNGTNTVRDELVYDMNGETAKVKRMCEQIVLNGSEANGSTGGGWSFSTSGGYAVFYTGTNVSVKEAKPVSANSEVISAVCPGFTVVSRDQLVASSGSIYDGMNLLSASAANSSGFSIKIPGKTTLDEVKAYLNENPITIVYELKTPEEETVSEPGEWLSANGSFYASSSEDIELTYRQKLSGAINDIWSYLAENAAN